MNSYTLIARMRNTRKWYKLTCTDQALFYELVFICNEKRWKEVFQCSNAQLCRDLIITEKTLIKSRKSLVNAGLIYYRPGKCNHEKSSYSFTTPFEEEEISEELPVPAPTTVPVPDIGVNSSYFTVVTEPNTVVTTVKETALTTVKRTDYNKLIYNKPPLSPKESESVEFSDNTSLQGFARSNPVNIKKEYNMDCHDSKLPRNDILKLVLNSMFVNHRKQI